MAGKKKGSQELALARAGDRAGFRRAIDKLDEKTLSALADELDGEERYAWSERVHRRSLALDPNDEDVWYALGLNLYYHQRKGAEAEAAFAEGLRLFPKDAFLNYGAAINLGWGLGRHTDALPLFQAAVAAAPKDAAMRAALAWCLLCVGKIAAGVDLAGRTLRSLRISEDTVEERLGTQTYLYLFAPADVSKRAFRALAQSLATGGKIEDWDLTPLVARARARKHPDSAWLAKLADVVCGTASPDVLADWPAWQSASSIPLRELVARKHDRAPSSSEGKVVVSGSDLVALFSKSSPNPAFVPPMAVEIAIAHGRIYSWRVEKRKQASGIGRGDYDWILEIYDWPGKTLLHSHTVQTRKVIEWFWPDGLQVLKTGDGRIVVFKMRFEDGASKLYVVHKHDGTFAETRDGKEAAALLKAR